ncbi:hypothetical protein [Microvirga sp. M2]|uniref:hypothetical protein n=1 Tax=Microvirga sp. M2 TaxID=3073270 RepID=UPI0039C2E055
MTLVVRMNRVEEAWLKLWPRDEFLTQRDLIRATGVPAVTLQNWANRKVFFATVEAPGKARKRGYSGFDVFLVGLGSKLVEFGLPPHQAFSLALAFLSGLVDSHHEALLATEEHLRADLKFWPENIEEMITIFRKVNGEQSEALLIERHELSNFAWHQGPVLVVDTNKIIIDVAQKLYPEDGGL